MIPTLEPELWRSHFARELMATQPRLPLRLAGEVAGMAWPRMGILKPRDAVQTFLEVASEMLAGELTRALDE